MFIGEDRRLPIVLIIDDDMVSREVMATVLTISGYTVFSAADEAESLAQLDAGDCAPEVILMDTQMPGLSGTQLIDALRARTKATLYATSGSDAPDGIKAAVDGFLMKPFGPEALQRLLGKHAPKVDPMLEPDLPTVSTKILAQFREMMPESAVREIYTAVVADLERRIAALSTAIAQCDAAEIRRIGHAIKGGCGMAGALQTAKLGALLEAGGDQLDNSMAILQQLRNATRKLQRMLDAEFPA